MDQHSPEYRKAEGMATVVERLQDVGEALQKRYEKRPILYGTFIGLPVAAAVFTVTLGLQSWATGGPGNTELYRAIQEAHDNVMERVLSVDRAIEEQVPEPLRETKEHIDDTIRETFGKEPQHRGK